MVVPKRSMTTIESVEVRLARIWMPEACMLGASDWLTPAIWFLVAIPRAIVV